MENMEITTYSPDTLFELKPVVNKGYRVAIYDISGDIVDIFDYSSLDEALINLGYRTCMFKDSSVKILKQSIYYIHSGVVSFCKKTYYL